MMHATLSEAPAPPAIDPADHQGLVYSIALKFLGRSGSLDLEDLVQEGNLGLLRAAEGFDPSRGVRFSTFASPWIRAKVRRAIAEKASPVRVPCYLHPLTRNRNQPLGRKARGYLAEARRALRPPGRLRAPAAPPTDRAHPADVAAASIAALLARLEKVEPRQAEVLRLRYGIGTGRPLNHREIGRRLGGVTGQCVRYYEARALDSLRRLSASLPSPIGD